MVVLKIGDICACTDCKESDAVKFPCITRVIAVRVSDVKIQPLCVVEDKDWVDPKWDCTVSRSSLRVLEPKEYVGYLL